MAYNVTLFASGNGSNVENIIKYFVGNSSIKILLVVCNNKDAFVLERTHKYKVSTKIISNAELKDGSLYNYLKKTSTTHIVLAGFMNLIPLNLVRHYKNRIINIHPALLPNYGGKGYYGDNVHNSVLKSGDNSSGITIHLVNEEYDKGKIIFQKSILINSDETLESLSSRIHELEYKFFPQIIEKYILNKL
jgi:phosphoribosylglycinamide formyltransferase-1